jgi:hypothetical protein
VSALLLLDPIPLPDGLSIPAEDWRETPMSVRHQVLSLLKQVETLEAVLTRTRPIRVGRLPQIPSRKSANDGGTLPSAASREPSLAILAITRCS